MEILNIYDLIFDNYFSWKYRFTFVRKGNVLYFVDKRAQFFFIMLAYTTQWSDLSYRAVFCSCKKISNIFTSG